MKNKNSIHYHITFIAAIIAFMVFTMILINTIVFVKPKSNEETIFLLQKNIETKALEVNQFIDSTLSAFRTFSIMPEFKAIDARTVEPLIMEINNSKKLKTQEISFIGKNGFCWLNSYITKSLVRFDEYNEAYISDNEFLISSPRKNDQNQDVLLLYYPIKGYNNEKNALICSVIPVYYLRQIVDSTKLFESKTWIMNKEHEIISCNGDYIYNEFISEKNLNEVPLENIDYSNVINVDGIKGKAHLFVAPVDNYDDWFVVSLVNNNIINENINNIITTYILVLCILLILINVLGRYLSFYILSPINILQDCMKEVKDGNLNAYYENKTRFHNEIDDVGNSFNYMLNSINSLIKRIYAEEKNRKDIELRMMNEQIKPHFLYNTLDNIRFLAKKNNDEEVAESIQNLSEYFRLSLNNGKEYVTIDEELRHTKSYLNMQKLRFNDNLSYFIDRDDEVKDFMVPKIIIQPIVENSIKHGNPNKDRNLYIIISVRLVDDYYEITVEDNGIGMSKDKVNKLKEDITNGETKGYGLANTYSRLKKLYGDNFEIKIKSIEKLSTTIKFKIRKEEA